MRLKLDFPTLDSKNFGVIAPIGDQVLALASPVDVWLPEVSVQNMVIESGRVSSWIGRRNGRTLVHTVASRRPRPEAGLLRFSSDLQLAEAQLDLTGTPIGQQNAFTFAVHARIHPEQIGADNQYIMGGSAAGNMGRFAYRFTNNTRYIRYQTNDNALNLDVPLPFDWNGIVGIVCVINGLNISMHLSTGATNSRALTVPFSLSQFMAAAAQTAMPTGAGSLRGHLGNLGLWTRAVTEVERDMLLRWVG